MPDASKLARQLARHAESVCRHYLPQGRRQGCYWLIGDTEGTPGRSLFVRLTGPDVGKGAAGKWTDAATGEHGDLLDLIAANQRLASLADTLDEARRFLALPPPSPQAFEPLPPVPTGSPEAARRLWAISQPIFGTLAETYLRQRGIIDLRECGSQRFHPHCWYRADAADSPGTPSAFPALIAAVRSDDGSLTGIHRTWLDPNGSGKAPVANPRRAMGNLLGYGVRFGRAGSVLVAGEGIETILSLRQIMPTMPMIAGLSAGHLSALQITPALHRLYIARDNDPAGQHAADTLAERAIGAGIEPLMLTASLGDFNDDLQRLGRDKMRTAVRVQLAPEDAEQFIG